MTGRTTNAPPRKPRDLRREMLSIGFVYLIALVGAVALARGCQSDRNTTAQSRPESQK